MAQVVPCPACSKQLQLPESLLGKSVRCPSCAHTFTAAPPGKTCPICAATVAEDAAVCGECGYHFTRLAAPGEIDDAPNVCPNAACAVLNPSGERLCQRCGTPLPGAAGQMIAGKYRIERPLAAGGFGVVYQGTLPGDGRPVAIKEMIAADPKEFEIRRTFFRREAEILKELQPLQIVPRLYDFIEEKEAAYLVMEYIPGDNLLNIMEKAANKPFPLARVVEWGAAVCEVLIHMHGLNPPVVHRDMKPENIMLLPDNRTIRLIDFGTARTMGSGIKDRRVAKTKVYTEGYAPPEQIMGKPEPRSDLFALAGTLRHLVSGEAPDGFLTGREMLKTLDATPVKDRWFHELIAINLAEDLNDRYFSAKDFRDDLRSGGITREVKCGKCAAMTPVRDPYCRGCAEPLTPPGVTCVTCARVSRLGSRFCTGCGARL